MADPGTDLLPLLSRGRHRTPRRGACLMELAGFLAGERWSDHPACTHPLLAELARQVNDHTSDAGRPRLARLAPAVIGLVSEDPRWNHEIALLVATSLLPFVPQDRRAPLAVGALTCERLMAEPGARPAELRRSTVQALSAFPVATEWARAFTTRTGDGRFTDHPGKALVGYGVRAVAESGRPDADDVLRTVLSDAVDLCRRLTGRTTTPPALDPRDWQPVLAPVAAVR